MAKTAAWQRKEGKNKEGGLNEKGRKSYERENPGSDLKAPQPEGGARKRSFCARMSGVKGPMMKDGKPTRKKLALDKWKCNEEALDELTMKKDKKVPLGRKSNPYGKRAIAKAIIKSFSEKARSKAGVTRESKEACGEGEYWCKDGQKCKPIPKGMHVMSNGDLMKGEVHKEEMINERQKDSDNQRLSQERGRSNYGKASVRNVRATGTGGNAADPAERLVAMDARHKAHKEKRGVKTKIKEEAPTMSTGSGDAAGFSGDADENGPTAGLDQPLGGTTQLKPKGKYKFKCKKSKDGVNKVDCRVPSMKEGYESMLLSFYVSLDDGKIEFIYYAKNPSDVKIQLRKIYRPEQLKNIKITRVLPQGVRDFYWSKRQAAM